MGVDESKRRLGTARAAQGVNGPGHELRLVRRVLQLTRRALVDLQRLREVMRGLVRSAGREGLVTGVDAGLQGGGQVVGCQRVAGQVRGSLPAMELADCYGVRRVQAHPFAGEQVVVHRLAEEGMPEGVLLLTRPHEHVRVDSPSQRSLELVLGDRGNRGQQVVRDPLTGGRCHSYDVTRALLEPVQPDEQQVREVLGQAPAAPQERTDQLLDVERIAL